MAYVLWQSPRQAQWYASGVRPFHPGAPGFGGWQGQSEVSTLTFVRFFMVSVTAGRAGGQGDRHLGQRNRVSSAGQPALQEQGASHRPLHAGQ